MFIENIKSFYKNTIPYVLDRSGYYDAVISTGMEQYLVPLYHRVVSKQEDDPYKLGMCVTKENFDSQLKYFSEFYNSISLPDYIQKKNLIRGSDKRYITLTFDDGYKDNLTNALPIIRKYNMNATVFICLHSLDKNENYWWDMLVNTVKETDLETLRTSGLDLDLPRALDIKGRNTINSLSILIKSLKNTNTAKQYDICRKIRDSLLGDGYEEHIDKLTTDDVVMLHKSGVEIGAHTVTHPDLRRIDKDKANYELMHSKNVLEEIIGEDVKGFAYPTGYYDENVIKNVKKNGFLYAASINRGFNNTFDKYCIQRISMGDTDISNTKRCIKKYV